MSRVVRTGPVYVQLSWSGDLHSVICQVSDGGGSVCSNDPTIIRYSPEGSWSTTIPSPTGYGGFIPDAGGTAPPLLSLTPASLVQPWPSKDTAENTCQP